MAIIPEEFVVLGFGGVEPEDSVAAISLDPSIPEINRTVTLVGTPDPASVNMLHLSLANLPANFSGTFLTANNDGTITVNNNVLAFKITCMAVCRYPTSDNIVLGIGIGDPTTLPTAAGTSTGTLPAGTYASRFRDASKGEGTARTVTLQTPYFPVGKTRELGAQAGDKVFAIMWTEETDNASVVFDDLIFAVEVITL